nr:acyl-CoA dehydrogenase family protein [Rhodococcus sp. (in: high G+C Gram-positive bacteria)]
MTLATSTPVIEAELLIDAIRDLRPQLSANGAVSDRDATDPAANFTLLQAADINRLLVPIDHGGAFWNGSFIDGWGTYVRAATEVCAGDGPTGQNWLTTGMVIREVFESDLPDTTKAEVARRVLHEGLRLVASNSEAGSPQPVIARPVEGGVILSGVKTFNSNSGSAGMANVGCTLDGPTQSRHHVLVDLTHPDVELRHDWDVMGQRGTYSQTIAYRDVFVADGWHYRATPPPQYLFGAIMLLHAAIQQGIGEGALHASVEYVRTLKRGSMPEFATAAEDPLILRRIGDMSSKLAASRAFLFAAADRVAHVDSGDDVGPATIDGYRSKVACVESSLAAAGQIFELTGARSTSNKYRLDRFWRNARTFASHDPTDAKNIYVGMYEVTGELPPLSAFLRV